MLPVHTITQPPPPRPQVNCPQRVPLPLNDIELLLPWTFMNGGKPSQACDEACGQPMLLEPQ